MRRGVLRSTAGIGVLTVADKGLAAGRHVLLAAVIGAGASMDSLVVGLSVAELLVALVTGSFLAVFIPLYAGWRAAEGAARADARALNVITFLVALLVAAAALVALSGESIVAWVGYGFGAQQRRAAGTLMPWLAVHLWGTGTAVLATGLYHVRGRFLTPQAAQIGERILVLAGIAVLAPRFGIRGVAMAIAAGALVLVALLAGGAVRRRGWPRPTAPARAPEVSSYIFLFLPLLGAAVVDQAVLFTDRAMASTLDAGAISSLYYASLMWGIPVTLLCTNFGTVLFPRLASDVAAQDPERLGRSLGFGLRAMVILMLPATALLVVLSRDLTAVLFERGQFQPESTALTASILAALAVCLVFQGIGNLINIALYAARRTGVVAACGVARVVLNVALNALLIGPLGAVGIALSTSATLGAWLGIIAVPFRREMRRRGVGPLWDAAFGALVVKALLAAGAAGAAAAVVAGSEGLAGASLGARLLRLAASGSAGLGAYALGLWLLRLPEATTVVRLLSARWQPRRGPA